MPWFRFSTHNNECVCGSFRSTRCVEVIVRGRIHEEEGGVFKVEAAVKIFQSTFIIIGK